ncbi:enoyl-CoA hydratase/isomerase family protein [Caulobacter sp. BE254]|uniref:enoyl-CoA hydratase/isomerase family protein n=1 Tax=Caulobacter sp. BE254 TaxID=2817720 RepID=UPI00285F6C87|nr:enoyl-CoA hydratase/isomerase family protein [Caulobacter sp. BE254]MDR7114433.1 enoyl-CoA hydratase/carnithine racemase [Caulobacter sp. BE254]
MSAASHLTVDRSQPGVWQVTFDNPPINMLAPAGIVELQALVSQVEADPDAKVLVFQSADPEFFIAHFDTTKAADLPRQPGPSGHSPWIDVVVRLARSPVVSIAKIRGRTRGVGSEFVLACDMRFASRQRAILGNPEVGVGLPPGGGALEWLPRLAGRSRALEIVLSGDDFDADLAERYGWINRALDDDALDGFVDALAARLASFDRQTLGDLKAQVNRVGVPTADELETSNRMFFDALKHPDTQARRARLGGLDYGRRGDFELNFGRYLPGLRPE